MEGAIHCLKQKKQKVILAPFVESHSMQMKSVSM